MRVKSVLKTVLGLCAAVVICGFELASDGDRPNVVVHVRPKAGRRGRCGRCGTVSPWFDNGGGQRRWRHVDVAYATCDLVGAAPRVSCPAHGPTVAEVSWARHDSWFTRAFEDLVVYDAISSNKNAAASRYGISWRAVENMCVRVATEALGRVDLLSDLVAIAIDEVKYKKGHKYLTVVCDHLTGRVIWAAKGRSKETVGAFFDALGEKRCAELAFVSCDGAEWIRTVVADRATEAIVCLDTFHVVKWATDALVFLYSWRNVLVRTVSLCGRRGSLRAGVADHGRRRGEFTPVSARVAVLLSSPMSSLFMARADWSVSLSSRTSASS